MAFRQLTGVNVRAILQNVWCRHIQKRFIQIVTGTEGCSSPTSRGLVLGVYSNVDDDGEENCMLTPVASKFDDVITHQNNIILAAAFFFFLLLIVFIFIQTFTNGRIFDLLNIAGPIPKVGECRVFYNLESNFASIALCGLGDKNLGYNSQEQIDESKEAIRIAAATGCKELQKIDTIKIYVEGFGDAECAAEGAALSLWQFQVISLQLMQYSYADDV